MGRPDFPAIEKDAIVGADDEVFAGRVKVRKNLFGLGHLRDGQATAKGVKNSGAEEQSSQRG